VDVEVLKGRLADLELITLPHSCADCLEILGAITSWSSKGMSRSVPFYLFVCLPQVEVHSFSRWMKGLIIFLVNVLGVTVSVKAGLRWLK
jgi:hypothetical protein